MVGTDIPRTGEFSCSNAAVNQLQSNIQWGMRGNYLSVPTDCPQRDERMGWMGDAEVFIRTATSNRRCGRVFHQMAGRRGRRAERRWRIYRRVARAPPAALTAGMVRRPGPMPA